MPSPAGLAGFSSSTNSPSRWFIRATLDAGDLEGEVRRAGLPRRCDLVAATLEAVAREAGGGRGGGANADSVPEEYKGWVGRISDEKTMPQLQKFVESGRIGCDDWKLHERRHEVFGIPVKNHLTRKKVPTAKIEPFRGRSFSFPGSLLKVNIDNTNPVAYGMPKQVDVFFDSSPVMRLEPNAEMKHTSAVAWFSGPEPLDSGWAWGQRVSGRRHRSGRSHRGRR